MAYTSFLKAIYISLFKKHNYSEYEFHSIAKRFSDSQHDFYR